MTQRRCRFVFCIGIALLSLASSGAAANAIYLGTAFGPYRSTDDGKTFLPLADKIGVNPHPLLRGVPFIVEIAMDPKDQRIVSMVGGYTNYANEVSAIAAFFRSVDAGEHWQVQPLIDVGNAGGIAARILIDPVVTNVIYILDQVDMTAIRSLDSGATWAPVGGLPASAGTRLGDLAIDPRVTRVLYARAAGSVTTEEPVYKSLDYGFTWITLGTAEGARGGHIFVDPRDSRHLILTAAGVCAHGDGSCGPYRSTDGGVTWENQQLRGSGGSFGQANPEAFGSVAYDPKTDRLYLSANLSGVGPVILSSVDGAAWSTVSNDPLLEATPLGSAPLSSDARDGGSLYSFRNVSLVDLQQQKILKSVDGAKSWVVQAALDPWCTNTGTVRPCTAAEVALREGTGPKIYTVSQPPTAPDDVLNVSAASFVGGALAAGSIASAFGPDLTSEIATAVEGASDLGGVSIAIVDGAGKSQPVALLSVAPAQANYIVPAGAALGPATVTIHRAGAPPLVQTVQIVKTAPGLFTFNGILPAAAVVRVSGDKTTYEDVFQLDDKGQIVPKPIDVLPATGQVYLAFYGTGIGEPGASMMTVNGFDYPVLYAGKQGEFAGLDQVNIFVPPSFAGAGAVAFVFKAEGQPSNTVFLWFR